MKYNTDIHFECLILSSPAQQQNSYLMLMHTSSSAPTPASLLKSENNIATGARLTSQLNEHLRKKDCIYTYLQRNRDPNVTSIVASGNWIRLFVTASI